MAKQKCVFCGREVGLLSRCSLSFCGTSQVVCSNCKQRYDTASPLDRIELEQQMLRSPDLENREAVEANLPRQEQEWDLVHRQSEQEQAARKCPVCGSSLACRLKDFSIGADGGGGLLTLLADTYVVDLYACPVCGKVELYTAASVLAQAKDEAEQVTCPVCGTRHSPLIGCPRCAKRKAEQGQRPSGSEQAARSRKPPWER